MFHSMSLPSSLSSFLVAPFPFTFFLSHSLFLSYKILCLQLFLFIICLSFINFFPYPFLLTVFIGFGCLLFFLSAFISYILLSHLRICLLNSIFISPISSRAFLSFRVPSFFTVPCHLHGMSLLQAVHGSTDMLRNHTSGSSLPTITLTKCWHVDMAPCDTQVNFVIQNNGL
jgi:hypothetical protein